jgi:uncharacterized protein (DUF488 family)
VTSTFAEAERAGNDLPVAGRIYSVGYEGFTLSDLVDRLASSKVEVLVDVRLNASSRRPGFSKKALSAALTAAGIEYRHERALGNPQDNRASFRDGDGESGRQRMREILSNGAGTALDRLVEEARARRVAVLCVERDRDRCHRQVITDMAQEQDASIDVVQIL